MRLRFRGSNHFARESADYVCLHFFNCLSCSKTALVSKRIKVSNVWNLEILSISSLNEQV